LPKLMLAGLTERDPGVVPVPVSGIPSVGFEALELSERVPLELPLAVGAKVTLKVYVWPAFKVTGGAIPLTL